MSDVTLGSIITGEHARDAIHIAVIPAVAGEMLRPGDHVSAPDKDGVVLKSRNTVGIVDPFLKTVVTKGRKFWLCLYQNTVTGMRHHWSHPAFDENEPAVKYSDSSKVKAEKWLRDFSSQINREYHSLLELGRSAIETGSAHAGDDDDQDNINEQKKEFLRNVAVVCDLELPEDFDDIYFSCAC
jgi:hypothetical protein